MTISFIFPDSQYLEFFKDGQNFIGYTTDHEEIRFVVVDQSRFVCNVDGMLCMFNPLSWVFMSEMSDMFQLDEMIPYRP